MLRRATLGTNTTTRAISATVQIASSGTTGTRFHAGGDDASFSGGVSWYTAAAFSAHPNCHPRWCGRSAHDFSASPLGLHVARARKSTVIREIDTEELAQSGQARSRGGAEATLERRSNLRSFFLADIGEGIKEVEILQWFVSPGDRVRQFDKICEVQSDKANVEISSRYDGIVRKLYHQVGDKAETGCVLVDIEEIVGGDGGPDPLLSSAGEGVARTTVESPAATGKSDGYAGGGGTIQGGATKRKILATPAVRRLLGELSQDVNGLVGVDIVGTGAGGRILKGDVLAYIAANGVSVRSESVRDRHLTGVGITGDDSVEAGGRQEVDEGPRIARSGEAQTLTRRPTKDGLSHGTPLSTETRGSRAGEPDTTVYTHGFEADDMGPSIVREERPVGRRREMKAPVAVPIRGMQRAMMETMRKALEVPHMTFCDEVNADRLIHLRAELKEAAAERGIKLSYLPLIIKATSMALAAHPTLNASLSEDKCSLLQHPDHNIGVAMDTSRGLLVPNIPCVQERTILEIAEELNTLQKLGAAGKLGEDELSGTTFTLSNIGSIAGTYTSPIILHPQVCIGALGRMQRVPRFDSADPDKIIGSSIIPISWSADHRIIDGGTIARFSNLWRAYLENPARMLADTR